MRRFFSAPVATLGTTLNTANTSGVHQHKKSGPHQDQGWGRTWSESHRLHCQGIHQKSPPPSSYTCTNVAICSTVYSIFKDIFLLCLGVKTVNILVSVLVDERNKKIIARNKTYFSVLILSFNSSVNRPNVQSLKLYFQVSMNCTVVVRFHVRLLQLGMCNACIL